MKNLLRPLACCCAFALLTFPAWSQSPDAAPTPAPSPGATAAPAVDPAKEVEIRKMLQLTGMTKLMEQMKVQMLNAFKQRGNVPDAVWVRLDKEMDMNQLVEQIIPLYDKYYSLDDLKAVNTFYSSPAGQRMLAALPQITRESMQIGQAWGQKIGMKVDEEIRAAKAADDAKNSGTSK
jgi:hypothetical protein